MNADQEAACAGRSEDASCEFAGAPGVCRDRVCTLLFCGDGVRAGTESCDRADLDGKTCAGLGFYRETTGLACKSDCTFDTRGCADACGDGVKNGSELCDGDDFGGADCRTAGFYNPDGLRCSPFCTFAVAGCTGYCGDGIVNGPERCDGAPSTVETCLDYGYDQGLLGCTALCGMAFDRCIAFGWRIMPSPIGATAVWGDDPHDQFAVSSHVGILHSNGVGWSVMTPINEVLNGIWGSASDDIFVVGSVGGAGAIRHWDGVTWSVTTVPIAEVLNTVWGSGATDVFAVGGTGSIVHWDGRIWSLMRPAPGVPLYGVWGSAWNDVYAVGEDGTILRWDGGTWTKVPLPTRDRLIAVSGSGRNDVVVAGEAYLGGEGVVWRWNGSQWFSEQDAGRKWGSLVGVWVSPAGGWVAVGEGSAGGGGIVESRDLEWSYLETTPVLTDVSGRSGELFAVGDRMLHSYGTSWNENARIVGRTLSRVWSTQDGKLVVASDLDGGFVRLDGPVSNRAAAPPTAPTPGALWGSNPSDLFLVGPSGNILHGDGTTWTPMSSRTTRRLNGVWGSGSSDVYAVGDAGTIVHWDGTEWNPIDSGIDPTRSDAGLCGVWGSGRNDVYAVGDGNMIVHWDGMRWTRMVSTLSEQFRLCAVWGSGPDDVYAVGGRVIFHWDGTRWAFEVGNSQLWSVAGSGAGDVFVAGENGLRHLRAGVWEPIALETSSLQYVRDLWVTPAHVTLVGDFGVRRLDRTLVTCSGPERGCWDGWDNDCDGLVDGADPDCAGKVAELCADWVDDDADGLADCADPDCASFPSCQ